MKCLPFAVSAFACSLAIVPSWGAATDLSVQQSDLALINFVADTGAAIRIEAGDMMRVVSQEIPAAACHLHNDVAPELAQKLLQDGISKFDRLLAALRNGDPDIGIMGPETHPKMIRMLEDLDASWQPFRDAASRIQSDASDQAALEAIYAEASNMLDETYLVLSELEGWYSNPVELLYDDAMLMEVSGRQAMLSQRVSYLACRKWSGSAGDDYIELLRTASNQYSFAMNALQNGAPELGIKPPPTPEIDAALRAVADETALIDGKIEILFETGTLDADLAADFYAILADKMYKLEKVAHMYAEYSKRVY